MFPFECHCSNDTFLKINKHTLRNTHLYNFMTFSKTPIKQYNVCTDDSSILMLNLPVNEKEGEQEADPLYLENKLKKHIFRLDGFFKSTDDDTCDLIEIKSKTLTNLNMFELNKPSNNIYFEILMNELEDADRGMIPFGILDYIGIKIKFVVDVIFNHFEDNVLKARQNYNQLDYSWMRQGISNYATYHINARQFKLNDIPMIISICNKMFTSYVIYDFEKYSDVISDVSDGYHTGRIYACKNLYRMIVINKDNYITTPLDTYFYVFEGELHVVQEGYQIYEHVLEDRCKNKLIERGINIDTIKKYNNFNVTCFINGIFKNLGHLTLEDYDKTIKELQESKSYTEITYDDFIEYIIRRISDDFNIYNSIEYYVDSQFNQYGIN